MEACGLQPGLEASKLGSIQSILINAAESFWLLGGVAAALLAAVQRMLSGLVSIRDAKAYEQSGLLGQREPSQPQGVCLVFCRLA
jgi:hypothetical protein